MDSLLMRSDLDLGGYLRTLSASYGGHGNVVLVLYDGALRQNVSLTRALLCRAAGIDCDDACGLDAYSRTHGSTSSAEYGYS